MGDCQRIYFGNECCTRALPDPTRLRALLALAEKKCLGVTFVTPVAQNADLELILESVGVVLEQRPDAEIAFNDWGVFAMLSRHYPRAQLVMGRVLHRTKRDPRYSQSVPEEQRDYASVVQASSPGFITFVQGLGVTRIGIDHLVRPLSLPDAFSFSLYYPHAFLTVGRACAARTVAAGAPPNWPGGCLQECQQYYVKTHSAAKYPMSFIGNAGYFLNPDPLPSPMMPAVNRLVFQPALPHLL